MNRLDVVCAPGLAAPPRPEGLFAGAVLPERPAELPVRSLDGFTRATASRVEDMARALLGREQSPPLPLHPGLAGKAFGRPALTDGPRDWRVAHIEPDGTSPTRLEDHTFATFL
ncbi:hypothetical protein ACFQ7A_29985 [Streptomyces sp. NPDC056528]|uniref:hypothetical protein n=1 Tax=Streptomyces sp. NPDC056528 TaxID=3345854 RepID=UPI0036B51594